MGITDKIAEIEREIARTQKNKGEREDSRYVLAKAKPMGELVAISHGSLSVCQLSVLCYSIISQISKAMRAN